MTKPLLFQWKCPEGRKKMKLVCKSCHMELHIDNFFKQGDKAVRLYNEAYYKPAKAMLDELKSKDLLKDNPWIDEFQITFYYLWHHQGRRARQVRWWEPRIMPTGTAFSNCSRTSINSRKSIRSESNRERLNSSIGTPKPKTHFRPNQDDGSLERWWSFSIE